MKKWKINGKRILVFFLVLCLAFGMTSHSKATVTAAHTADATEKEASEVTDDTEKEAPEITDNTGKEAPEITDNTGKEAPEITDDTIMKDTTPTICICTVSCSEDTGNEDCPLCMEDVSACSNKEANEPQDESSNENAKQPASELSELAVKQQKAAYAQIQPAAAVPSVKEAWNAMTAAMTNWDAEIDLSIYNLTANDMNSIWPDVAQDNPDLFYVLGNYYTTSPDGIVQKCRFTYNTAYNKKSVAEYKAAIDRVFAEVIEANMSDEQKATSLHDYLVQHMVYDQNANNNLGIEKRNAYEALVNGIGVCEGYTLAYAALLKKAGIESDYCKSKAMNHIWNYVKLDGKWYHADLTYDDATAKSQVGEMGYVKHSNFLLSDAAMSKTHNWDANDITCSSTKYDNSWHKTAPLSESAIYTVNGSSYYLKGETVANNPNIYRGATLVKRNANGAEVSVGTFDIENLGNGWPMFPMCFSRLSCSKGILYFNVGNSVYSFNPSVNTAPINIYKYSDADNRIVTGLLASGDNMTVEIYNPQTSKIEKKITVPIFTLSAAPVLKAHPLASGFIWSKQRPDGSWDTINGANGSEYTIESGLPAGSYKYRVEATLEGRSVMAEIIITVTPQVEQSNFAFPESTKKVTYGDAGFTISAHGAEAGAVVTYSSSSPSVASVDPKTGAVIILKAGSTVITATASETENHLEAKSTYTLTVSPKTLTWDVSALEAVDRLDSIKGSSATLYGELKLKGILEKDLGTIRFQCPSSKLSGVYETVAAGSQKVKLSWKDAQDKAVLQGDGTNNYTLPSSLPEIMGRISVVTDSSQESTDGVIFKIQVENGISKVPDSFKDKEHLNSPLKIEKEMRLKIQELAGKITDENIVVYDVELLVNTDGLGWQSVTKDNFPADGLNITLPYPSGTGRDTHDFTVAHMFTADMNGFYAGDVEYPTVTKTENGITFKVYGLSPIAIGWEEATSNPTGSKPNEEDEITNSSTPDTPASDEKITDTPLTGDSVSIILYTLMAAVSLTMMAGLYIKAKRSR